MDSDTFIAALWIIGFFAFLITLAVKVLPCKTDGGPK